MWSHLAVMVGLFLGKVEVVVIWVTQRRFVISITNVDTGKPTVTW